MELLVRIVDKPKSGNAALDSKRTTAGDVIAVKPDGHIWGKREVASPEWRILRVPGMGESEAESLVAAELATAFAPNRLLRKRQMTIDIEQLDLLTGGEILADRRATPRGVDAVVSRAHLRACLSLKPALTDPRIIGPRRAVIG